MLGSIIGDIAGSRFEWDNCRSEAYYGIPNGFGLDALAYLDEDLARIVIAFEKRYPRKRK